MIIFLIGLAIVTFMLWIGYKLTGAVLKACVWSFIQLPLALILWVLGLVCCITLILIPVGRWLFKLGWRLLIP